MKILVVDIGPTSGGVERIVDSIYDRLERDKYHIDFLVYGDMCYHEEKYVKNGNVFKVPKRYCHPIRHYNEVKKFFMIHKDYDVVWIHTRSCSNINAHKFARKYTNARIITHSHAIKPETNGVIHKTIANVLISINQKKLLAYTDYAIGCSKAAYQYMFGAGYKGEGKVIINGIDLDVFRFNYSERDAVRKEYGIDEDTTVIGHIGRFVPVKNHKFIIDMFSHLIKVHPKTCVMFVGDGAERESVKTYVKKNKLENSVFFVGEISNTEAYYSAFDVFMLPSMFEGLSLVSIEAQAEGLQSYISDDVPEDVIATDYIYRLNLVEGAEKWAEIIANNLKLYKIDRNLSSDKLRKTAFDIDNTVEEIKRIFDIGELCQ